MSVLRADQTSAVLDALGALKPSDPVTDAMLRVLASCIRRRITLEQDQLELLRVSLLLYMRDNEPTNALEAAFYRLYNKWPVEPPYWHREGIWLGE